MSSDWGNKTPDEIFYDLMRLIDTMEQLTAMRSNQIAVPLSTLTKLGFHIAPEPEYANYVWRGHRFVVSDDALAVSRDCADALRSYRL